LIAPRAASPSPATELFFWIEPEPCLPTQLTLNRNSGQADESNP
jgi:hypothetical protein